MIRALCLSLRNLSLNRNDLSIHQSIKHFLSDLFLITRPDPAFIEHIVSGSDGEKTRKIAIGHLGNVLSNQNPPSLKPALLSRQRGRKGG